MCNLQIRNKQIKKRKNKQPKEEKIEKKNWDNEKVQIRK